MRAGVQTCSAYEAPVHGYDGIVPIVDECENLPSE